MSNTKPPTTTTAPVLLGDDEDVFIGALDQLIAKGLRLWMLLAMILAILLIMMIIICCLIKIRIPRTKREIELAASHRRGSRRSSKPVDLRNYEPPDRGCKVIVMSTSPSNERVNLLLPTTGQDPESVSCTSCATTSEHSRNQTPFNGSSSSLNRAPMQQEHLRTVRQLESENMETETSKHTSV